MRIVDTREPWSIRSELIKLGWEQEALKTGDYFFTTVLGLSVGIERKTIGDFSDIPDIRDSLQKIIISHDIPILLLEGRYSRTQNNYVSPANIPWDQMWNFLQSFQDTSLRVQPTTSESHTVQRLGELYTYYQSPDHKSPIPRKYSTDPRVLALAFIPGISISTSRLLLEHFKSIEKIANAKIDELQGILGIGPRKAEMIYDFFRQEY